MSLIYIIKTNSEHFYFHYVSKLLKDNDKEVSLTTTESKFLLKLCQSQIQGTVITVRTEMESHIWGDEAAGIDRKANLNQLICTLRKKLAKVTTHSVIITQPKKGYSLDDCVYVELSPSPSPETSQPAADVPLTNKIPAQTLVWLRQFTLPVVGVFLMVINGYLFSIYPEESPPIKSIALNQVEANRGVLTSAIKEAMTISCIEKMVNRTVFTNYFILGLKESDMSNKWEKKVCDLL
ncbi:hypothetical protein VCR3J2_260020 [Vibrio coralliirubri]|uniref:helix-turn-helix domain-containing protein n=1 Tax=Vibrio coralliirubri TaxID=1516159 RepID=UPI000633A96E|nr:helix-turn-helix domain-containing protein [Vibrio coralliirubri]CDT82710.1 hypothetical protein VCR3J2_260020 [Vibrio coralliirubri]